MESRHVYSNYTGKLFLTIPTGKNCFSFNQFSIRCFKKVIHQIDSKKWIVAPFSKFYGRIWVGFCLNTGNNFFLEVLRSTKNGTRDFQNGHPFKRSTFFYLTISGNFERFQHLTLKQILWKTKTFFKKLVYCFLVESTRI